MPTPVDTPAGDGRGMSSIECACVPKRLLRTLLSSALITSILNKTRVRRAGVMVATAAEGSAISGNTDPAPVTDHDNDPALIRKALNAHIKVNSKLS